MKILSNFKLNYAMGRTAKLLFALAISTLSLACSSSSSSNNNSGDSVEPLPPAPKGLYLRPLDEATVRVYSNGDSTIENADGTETRNADTLGKGLLNENTDASSESIEIGTFGHDEDAESTGTIAYELADKDSENKNDDFKITDGKKLFYKGSASGDFEAEKNTLTISIIRTDSTNPDNPETFTYIIRLINLNDNPTVLTKTPSADFNYDEATKTLTVPENQAEGTLFLTVSATDEDATG